MLTCGMACRCKR